MIGTIGKRADTGLLDLFKMEVKAFPASNPESQRTGRGPVADGAAAAAPTGWLDPSLAWPKKLIP